MGYIPKSAKEPSIHSRLYIKKKDYKTEQLYNEIIFKLTLHLTGNMNLILTEKSGKSKKIIDNSKPRYPIKKQVIMTEPPEAEIDRLVYELYGLTEEEIRIVEGG